MTINLLKVTTKTCIVYFQTHNENDIAVCVLSSNYKEIKPGKSISWQNLTINFILDDIIEIETI